MNRSFFRATFASFCVASVLAVAPAAVSAAAPVGTFKFQVMGANKTYKFTDMLATKSKGAQSWSVKGDCTINKAKKTVTANEDGTCQVNVNIKKAGKFKAAKLMNFFTVDYFPVQLPEPAGNDNSPATEGTTAKGWFQGQFSSTDGTSFAFSSAYGETSDPATAPYISCRRYTDDTASITVAAYTGAGEQNMSLRLYRTVYTSYTGEKIDSQNAALNLYADSVSTNPTAYGMDIMAPASEYSDNFGAGTTGVTLDGAGARFNLQLVAVDASGEPVKAGATATLTGYVNCSW